MMADGRCGSAVAAGLSGVERRTLDTPALIESSARPTDSTRDLILATLRGEEINWPSSSAFATGFLDVCRDQGLAGLVYESLKQSGMWAGVPSPVRSGLIAWVSAARRIRELVDAELGSVLREIALRDIPGLVFKGTALAHVLYPKSWLRSSADTDLLVRAEDRMLIGQVLTGMGYRRREAISGELLMKQASYSRRVNGFTIVLDIQWDYSQAQVLAGLLDLRDLGPASRPIPEISPLARTLSAVDSLILACAHWAGHQTGRRLIWLYDIHLMIECLGKEGQEEFCRKAAEKQVRAVCLEVIRQAAGCFGTRIPESLCDALIAGEPWRTERSVALLSHQSRARRIWGDLQDVRSLSAKLRLMREYLLPPVGYIRHRYQCSNPVVLPALYAHRLLSGFMKLAREATSLNARRF